MNRKIIAFHLPQFHSIPENDEWWGKGFTEWTNVTKATPLFPGHRQPKLPGDLGFYDLRLPEAREQQAQYAKEAGIYGFCYWHYWFGHGRQLLEKPINQMLETNVPNFPFILGWANQTWTGIWHGAPNRILVKQSYPGRSDVEAHCKVLMRAFSHPNYITLNGRPIFYIYDPESEGFSDDYLDMYRETLRRKWGIEIYIIYRHVRKFLKSADGYTQDPLADFIACGESSVDILKHKFSKVVTLIFGSEKSIKKRSYRPRIFDYRKGALSLRVSEYESEFIPMLMANWDNTPRSGGDGYVAKNFDSASFTQHVKNTLSAARRGPFKEFYFLKSWNEWAEGNYLEPDLENGRELQELFKRLTHG